MLYHVAILYHISCLAKRMCRNVSIFKATLYYFKSDHFDLKSDHFEPIMKYAVSTAPAPVDRLDSL